MSSKRPLHNIGAVEILQLAVEHHGTLRQKTGLLVKFNAKWPSRLVVVQGGFLYIFKDQYSKNPSDVHSLSDLENVKADNGDDRFYGFVAKFENPKKEPLFFTCESDKTRAEWIKVLEDGISRAHDSGISIGSAESVSLSVNYSGYSEVSNLGRYEDLETYRPNADSSNDSGFVFADGPIRQPAQDIPVQEKDRRMQHPAEMELLKPVDATDDLYENSFSTEHAQASAYGHTLPKPIDHSASKDFPRAAMMDELKTQFQSKRFGISDNDVTKPKKLAMKADSTKQKPPTLPKPSQITSSSKVKTDADNTRLKTVLCDSENLEGGATTCTEERLDVQLETTENLYENKDGEEIYELPAWCRKLHDALLSRNSQTEDTEESLYENIDLDPPKETYYIEKGITRQDIERKLHGQQVGTFVVYESTTGPLVLALVTPVGNKFSKIYHQGDCFYLLREEKFATLQLLLQFYKTKPLSWNNLKVYLLHGALMNDR